MGLYQGMTSVVPFNAITRTGFSRCGPGAKSPDAIKLLRHG
jgi:hypothetical protein